MNDFEKVNGASWTLNGPARVLSVNFVHPVKSNLKQSFYFYDENSFESTRGGNEKCFTCNSQRAPNGD